MSRTILQSNQPHIITQDSNTARNLFLYTRNEKISTHRQHIRVATSSISKHLAVRLQHTFPTQPPPPLDPLITHAVTTMPQSEDMQAKEPQVIDLHTTFPSFKVKSHQLTATGEPKPKQLPLPCYSIVHSNHWADTICTFFTNKVLTYKLPIHSHKPSNPTPFHKYALTISDKLIDKSTTDTIQHQYHDHINHGLGRRAVAGWCARYATTTYKPIHTFPATGITRPLLLYTAVSHSQALR